MKSQFSVIFTTILIVGFLIAIILITAIFSFKQSYNIIRQNEFTYSDLILYSLFSPNCIGSYFDSIFYTSTKKIENFSVIYNNTFVNCTYFPYPFKVYVENYVFGIENYKGNCYNNSYFISIGGRLSKMNIEICYNFYSDFYYYLYNFCTSDINESSKTFTFLSIIKVYENKVCFLNNYGNFTCNYIPCEFENSITLKGPHEVYLEKINGKIKIV